jgi:hypothetical protein
MDTKFLARLEVDLAGSPYRLAVLLFEKEPPKVERHQKPKEVKEVNQNQKEG